MKPLKIFLIIALLLAIAIPASVALVFYDGHKYLTFSESTKLSYVAGLSDMANTLIQYYEPEKAEKIYKLKKDMLLDQMVLILNRYLEEHPEALHNSAAVSFLNAFDEIIYRE
ncbi:unnamed protein product [marine sediment metagenome]|uniref:Uncharacterized protein n=1 Tax=marine sediment metagenome TaxID=412755 RepID=X1SF95_9ZZZZ